MGGEWQLASSISEAWRFRGLHTAQAHPVGAFARPDWIPARVPGSVHADLIRAGLIADPNFGLASLEAEWVSARQWVYRRTFCLELSPSPRLHLCFEGADHGGEVYLNGEWLGSLAGTHTPVRLEVSGLDPDREHLLVVILPEPPAEAGQLGRTSQTQTLKPRAGYWWDFGARLVHVGLWRGVSLQADAGTALLDIWPRVTLAPDLNSAKVEVRAQLEGNAAVPVTFDLIHPDGRTETQTAVQTGEGQSSSFDLPDPQLWWPAQLGAQPLYTLRASVPGDSPQERRFGVRQVALIHNAESSARGARPYTLEVNGQPLYLRGFNLAPTDLIPGRDGMPDRERVLVTYALAAHANLLRVNGVGPVASRAILDACDEGGLLIWQEMPLTSSGTDNVPPHNPAFLAHLERDLPALVRHLRCHPCVVLLGGGNELTDERRVPVTGAEPTLQRMAQIVDTLDGTRPWLPSSPSGPEYDLSLEVAVNRPHDLHDVHGPWHYRGTDSYALHSVNRALAHTEFGCQAAPREATLHRYLTAGPLWPVDDRNPQVVHHGEWWLMHHRIEEVFGPVDDLSLYVLLTQAVQGDVLRHALLRNRARQGECSVSLVWQLNEPWPNAHNTSLIDYDLKPKLAYSRCREANAPTALDLGLAAPVADEHLILRPQVLAEVAGTGQLTLTLHTVSGMSLFHETRPLIWPAAPRSLTLTLPDQPALLRAELYSGAGTHLLARTEHWVARAQPQPFAALAQLPRTSLTAEQRGGQLSVHNSGAVAAPWVSVEAPAGATELFSDNGFALLPGETRELEVSLQTVAGAAWSGELTVRSVNADPVEVIWAEAVGGEQLRGQA
ncbi:glycoside hydrolase family 2 protein [Deinococcus oregonensis]|uniref:Beta-mannosidase n=1 Tax=Deinococcus oregonensis TaxID=1805970 RepID=A0ABV6AUF1_9DEIO